MQPERLLPSAVFLIRLLAQNLLVEFNNKACCRMLVKPTHSVADQLANHQQPAPIGLSLMGKQRLIARNVVALEYVAPDLAGLGRLAGATTRILCSGLVKHSSCRLKHGALLLPKRPLLTQGPGHAQRA